MKVWLGVFAGMAIIALAQADVIDELDTTNNFFGSFNGTVATNNGDGTVSLIRNTPDVDAGIDWRNGGQAGVNLSLTGEHLLSITPVAAFNGGYWNASILFFSNETFVGEANWISDNNSLDVRMTNVAQFATSVGGSVTNASHYIVRFRVQPFDQSNVGFTFTQITAVPEPSALLLMLLGALAWPACKLRSSR